MSSAVTVSEWESTDLRPPFGTAEVESSHPAVSVLGAAACVTSARARPRTGSVRASAVLRNGGTAAAQPEHAFASAAVQTSLVLARPVRVLRLTAWVDLITCTVTADDNDACCGAASAPCACICVAPTISCWSWTAERSTQALELRLPGTSRNRPAGPARVITTLRTAAGSPMGPARVLVGVTAGAHVRRQCLCGRSFPGSGLASAEVAAVVRTLTIETDPA